MFGKPHWFRKKTVGWGLTPVTFMGRTYAGIWAAVLVLPFAMLVMRHQPIEGMIWLVAAGGFLLYDVRHIMVSMKPPAQAEPVEDVLYIGDEETPVNRLATRNFDFQLRR
jgi:hypothetical protein